MILTTVLSYSVYTTTTIIWCCIFAEFFVPPFIVLHYKAMCGCASNLISLAYTNHIGVYGKNYVCNSIREECVSPTLGFRCGLEAEDCFSLVQSFCLCHQLPPSVAFLTVCCREGQWLPMLCQSQLHNIKPQKVRGLDIRTCCVYRYISVYNAFEGNL